MIKLIGARPQILGDTLFTEVILNYWKNLYPDSEITWILARKCRQALKFWQNHPKISNILISKDLEGEIYEIDGKIYNQRTDNLPFDVRIANFNPPAPTDYTYNSENSNCVTLAWKMASLDLKDYYNLPENQQRPRLYKTGPVFKYKKTIAVWCFAGYGTQDNRSPSEEWWKETIQKLIERGYVVFHFGHPKEPKLSTHYNYFCMTDMELYDQVMISIGCDAIVGTDSGSMWLCGAFGQAPLISLNTYSFAGHHQNPCALAPMHYSKKQINLFDPNSCSHIPIEEVLKSIKDLS